MDKEFVSDMTEEEEECDGDVDDSNGKSKPCSNILLSTGGQQQARKYLMVFDVNSNKMAAVSNIENNVFRV